jgi:hypothetical protein
MNFTELENLRRLIGDLRETHVLALKEYYDPISKGFARTQRQKPKLSLASTSTCLASLVATGNYDLPECQDWKSRQGELADNLFNAKMQSAGLENTVFTTAFVLEAITMLCDKGVKLDDRQKTLVIRWEDELANSLNSPDHPGGVAIEPGNAPADSDVLKLRGVDAADPSGIVEEYPPTAYVTQLVARALIRRRPLDRDLKKNVRRWAVAEINRQIALFASSEKTADAYALAYSTILLANLSSSDPSLTADESTPEEANLARAAVKLLFDKQLEEDGTWLPSRPLFHYPGAGNAYCFEYEMLVQLLDTESLRPVLLDYLDKLGRAVRSLNNRAFVFKSRALAWASGHHPQNPGPESWSTASVYHFLYKLDRLVAEAVRQEIFVYLDQLYKKPTEAKTSIEEFLPSTEFLDSVLWIGTKSLRLRDVLIEFVDPIAKGAKAVRANGSLPSGTKMSAIFFGPPGTSKTELVKKIAEFLGWPHLNIDPSHLVRFGMDRVQEQANTVFSMLAASEEIVVLLDEFDEMVRERASSGTEALSRFLTTAMLPKLTLINKRRSIVFILATNHIEQFDFAISRLGRFDRIIQIMPPSAAEKRRRWVSLNKLPASENDRLELLTFSECEKLVEQLSKGDPRKALAAAVKNCTLKKNARPLRPKGRKPLTWEKECKAQRKHNRL